MLNRLTISQLTAQLATRKASALEAVRSCFDRIGEVDARVHAFLSLDEPDAIRQAKQADGLLDAGKTHAEMPLLGVPVAIKDVISVRGQPLTCASRILGNYRSPYDATVIERLRAAGAIVFGRTNLDEFAMGSSTENSAFGPTFNPWDLSRTPGGSSGGSAAAVVSDFCSAALGSDTGGSIRQPAALVGCVGFKPSYGLVSRSGLVAFASSLDQIGPLTKDVRDAAMMLNAISGWDQRDSTSIPKSLPDYTACLSGEVKGIRLGIPKEYAIGGLDVEVDGAVKAALKHLERLGAEIVEISLPHTEYSVATYYIVATAEASANLARFDGVRYGLRIDGDDPLELYSKTRGAGFGAEVKRRIILGTYVLSSGYYDAYYLRAQKVRTLIRQDFLKAFEKVDAIVTPTTPGPAFKIGEKIEDPLQMYLSDIFTISCNLAGICGMSIPCGFTANPKLPIGLQFLGRPFGEETLLRVAHAFEQTTPWHKERPVL